MFDLAHDEVTGHYWRGLNAYKRALSDFEPLACVPGVGPTIAEWLLERGLLEVGDNPRYRDFGPCYRLTDLGWQVIERGQRPKNARPRPKLKTLPPRIPIIDTSIARPPKKR